jgi:pyruvate dehydrogenase E2 component (dihydrolipoamide acetyltransferase)
MGAGGSRAVAEGRVSREGVAFWTLGGKGPQVLLLHGFGADHLSWLANQQALATEGTVCALDLPGHGESAMDVSDGTVATLADKIAALLDRVGLRDIHVIGHSLGGGVALLLAETRPDLVASLVLIASAGLDDGVDAEFLSAFPRVATEEAATQLLQRLVVRPRLINRHMVARVLAQLERPGAREALERIAAGLTRSRDALASALASTAVRSLRRMVIWGARDVISPVSAKRLDAFGGETVVIAEAGHMPHVEAPRLVNETIVAFLSRQTRP